LSSKLGNLSAPFLKYLTISTLGYEEAAICPFIEETLARNDFFAKSTRR